MLKILNNKTLPTIPHLSLKCLHFSCCLLDLVHLFNNKKETVIATLMATYSIELAYHNFLT